MPSNPQATSTRPLTRRQRFMAVYAESVADLRAAGKLPTSQTDNAQQGAESVATAAD